MNKKILYAIITIIIIAIIGGIAFAISNSQKSETNTSEGSTNKLDEQVAQTSNNKERQESSDINNEKTDANKKTLILYFSRSGNTEKFANLIHNKIGGDIVKIEPKQTYPTEYNELAEYAKNERDNNERPEIKNTNEIKLDDYDTIFIGYPIWWYQMPMIMYTLFDNYDFSGKAIVPFNTHEGSGNGGTYKDIEELETRATVLEGLPIRGGDMEKDQTSTVNNWLEKLGF